MEKSTNSSRHSKPKVNIMLNNNEILKVFLLKWEVKEKKCLLVPLLFNKALQSDKKIRGVNMRKEGKGKISISVDYIIIYLVKPRKSVEKLLKQ